MVCDKVASERQRLTKMCVKDVCETKRLRQVTPATQNASGSNQVPILPRRTAVTKSQFGHAKRRWMWLQVPLLPRETKVDVAKCHACHAKPRWMPPSATPATWNQGGCRQVPRLPRKVPHRRPKRAQARHQSQPSAIREVHVAKCQACHACHAKRRWMWPSATLATRNEGGCR